MDTESGLESTPLAKVYHLSSKRFRSLLLLYSFGAIPMCLIVLALFLPQLPWSMAPGWFKVYFMIILIPVASYSALLFVDRISVHLMTSPYGITYKGIGYRIFTPWNNVAGSGVRTVATELRGQSRQRQLTGLVLFQPAPVVKAELWAGLDPRKWRR